MTVKRWLLVGSALTVIACAAAFLSLRAAASRDTEEFVAEASGLKMPPGWTRKVNIVRPVQYPCLSTNPCPSIFWRWHANEPVSADLLRDIAARTNLDLTVDRPCERRSNVLGDAVLCMGTGVKHGYEYRINVFLPAGNEFPDVIVDVRPAHPKS